MTKPTSQTFNTLRAAEQPDDILQAIAKCIWEADKNEGDPPVPSVSDIQEFTSIPESPIEEVFVQRLGECYFVWQAMTLQLSGLSKDLEDVPIFISTDDDFPKEIDETRMKAWTERILDENRDDLKEWLKIQLKEPGWPHLKKACDFNAVSNHLLRTAGEPTQDGAQWLHQEWKSARKQDAELAHPFTPIVREWIQTQTAKPITLEYDQKHPIGILKHPMGSVRDVSFVELGETAHLREFATPNSRQQVESTQLQLFPPVEKTSILPAVMPLQIAHPMGLKPKTKAGAVSHEIRIFFEALMALEPDQQQVEMMFRLGDLIRYLYPDGKFNRTNQLPYIINALEALHFHATVPWRDDQGDLRRWRPVYVKSPLEINSKNETPVLMRVEMPPDAKQGMAVDKQILRGLGKASAPQFNAYLTAAWLWDKYGTHQGKIIDPTRPVERRNSENALVDENDKPLVNPHGKKITNLYDTHAVKQSERELNPAAIKRYPALSDEDLIYACFPNTNDTQRKRLLKRAQTHWTELEKAGIVRIERLTQGWRILPGASHVEKYRGVKQTQKR